MRRIHKAWLPLLGLVLLLASPDLTAGTSFDGWSVVGDDELARMRGGFDTGFGTQISFGIERLTFLNGELQGRISFDLAPGQLVQFSMSNTADGLPTFMTTIQNNLDGQRLQGLTLINASVNTLGAFRSMQTGLALERALVGVVH